MGGITRADTTKKELALIFTGDEFADGGEYIREMLIKHDVSASFFFTGNFYRNNRFNVLIENLLKDGHYLGAHSDQHLLYCSWENRDSLFISKQEFKEDLIANYLEMAKFGISKDQSLFFLPPYEWYNKQISNWTSELNLQLVNFSNGTRSNADYTSPRDASYISSQKIYDSIVEYESSETAGLNGFLLLLHIGVTPERTDKFYFKLEELIIHLKSRGYSFKIIAELIVLD